MWRAHRLDPISAKKPAKLLDSKSLTLGFSRKRIWPVFLCVTAKWPATASAGFLNAARQGGTEPILTLGSRSEQSFLQGLSRLRTQNSQMRGSAQTSDHRILFRSLTWLRP